MSAKEIKLREVKLIDPKDLDLIEHKLLNKNNWPIMLKDMYFLQSFDWHNDPTYHEEYIISYISDDSQYILRKNIAEICKHKLLLKKCKHTECIEKYQKNLMVQSEILAAAIKKYIQYMREESIERSFLNDMDWLNSKPNEYYFNMFKKLRLWKNSFVVFNPIKFYDQYNKELESDMPIGHLLSSLADDICYWSDDHDGYLAYIEIKPHSFNKVKNKLLNLGFVENKNIPFDLGIDYSCAWSQTPISDVDIDELWKDTKAEHYCFNVLEQKKDNKTITYITPLYYFDIGKGMIRKSQKIQHLFGDYDFHEIANATFASKLEPIAARKAMLELGFVERTDLHPMKDLLK